MAAERSTATSAGAVARRAPNPRPGIAAGPVVKDPIQAREIARDWVVSAGFSPTEDRITALLPVARVWSLKARKVAIGLVAAGQLPTRAAVESVTHKLIEARKQVAAQLRTEAEAFVSARGPEAAAWVRAFNAAHGHGPLWCELGQALQLNYRVREATIRALDRAGWITTSPEPRSMRPGPRADSTPVIP